MNCHGVPRLGRGRGARGSSLDCRKKNILMGQCWKQQEMGCVCPHGDPATGVGESGND